MFTEEDAKKVLEEILPSDLCRNKKERDNLNLSPKEIDSLYQIVIDCEELFFYRVVSNEIRSELNNKMSIVLSDDEINALCQIIKEDDSKIEVKDLCEKIKNVIKTKFSDDEYDKDIKIICQIVKGYRDKTITYSWKDWKKQLNKVVKICLKFNNVPQLGKGGRNDKGAIPTSPNKMPWLIKQVLFYAYADCCINRIKVTDKVVTATDILDELDSKGLTLSHNFFSRTERAVNDYVSLKTYVEPKAPFNYNGKKYGCLLNSVSSLTADERKHILAVINSLVNGDLTEIWW